MPERYWVFLSTTRTNSDDMGILKRIVDSMDAAKEYAKTLPLGEYGEAFDELRIYVVRDNLPVDFWFTTDGAEWMQPSWKTNAIAYVQEEAN